MRRRGGEAGETAQQRAAATLERPDASSSLVDLVRLLARQAAREFVELTQPMNCEADHDEAH